MSIGLYDIDFMTFIHVPFNLEIMKLASYFKSKKEVTILTSYLEPERYSQCYIRKDFNDGVFPKPEILSKVNYGGYAFSNNKYVPLDLAIEKQYPDKSIYIKYKDLFCLNKTKELIFHELMNMEHIRISLDNKTIENKLESSIKLSNSTNILMFHDYNLNDIQDSELYVKDLFSHLNDTKITSQLLCTKFPIQVENISDLLKWSQFNPAALFGIQYNGLIPDDGFYELLSNPQKKSFCNRLIYDFTQNSVSENNVIQNILPKIYKQALFAKSLGIKILLKYTDHFFINKKWEKVIDLMNLYFSQNVYRKVFKPGFRDFSTTFTLYRYITSQNFQKFNIMSIEELRELFNLVRVENYELFKMFYEVAQVEYIGGKFQ